MATDEEAQASPLVHSKPRLTEAKLSVKLINIES
jgi:hypothetical protein